MSDSDDSEDFGDFRMPGYPLPLYYGEDVHIDGHALPLYGATMINQGSALLRSPLIKSTTSNGDCSHDRETDKSDRNDAPDFPFLNLPYELQYKALQKFQLSSFRVLEQTCREIKNRCETVKIRYPMNLDYLKYEETFDEPHYSTLWSQLISCEKLANSPVRLHVKKIVFDSSTGVFNQEFAERLLKQFRYVNADMLIIRNDVTCSGKMVVQMLEMLGCLSLDISRSPCDPGGFYRSPPELLGLSEIRRCKTLLIGGQQCSEEDFMDISCTFFRVSIIDLKASVVSRYIRDWIMGKREIGTFDIRGPESFFDDFDQQLECLGAFELPPEPQRHLVFYGVRRQETIGRIRIYRREFFTFTSDPNYVFP